MSSPAAVRKSVETSDLSWEDYRLLIQGVVEYAIFMLHPDGRVATWNAGAERIKGYKDYEIIGEHFSKFYPAADVEAGKPERELVTAQEFGRVEDEGWRLRKDGSPFWANVVITALRDQHGTLRGFSKVTRDLTERRNAEERLRQSEERFRLMVESVTDCALYVLDSEGRVSTWNLGAERMTGYKPNEVIGHHFSMFFSEQDAKNGKPQQELEGAHRAGRFEGQDWRIRKDGTPFWVHVTLTPLRSADGVLLGYAKVTRDLTAMRQAEETERHLVREQVARAVAEDNERRLRESEEAAKEAARRAEVAAERAEFASRVKDDFLATVSHELRTPLTAILGWTSLLRSRGIEPPVAKGIEVIHRNAQTQARIIDDILDVSRIVNGKLRIELKSADFVAIVNEAIDVVRPSADAKRISIEFVPDAPHVLVGDPERLQQVVWNLLSNAVKFTPTEGRVVVSIAQQGSTLELSVEDNGLGIDPDFLPHVFERFNQGDGSTTRRVGGLGLGLAVVRHIVELHGGSVEAKSAGKGQGALFRVTVPVRALSPQETNEPQETVDRMGGPQHERVTLTGVRVLVVDNDPDARDLLDQVLAGAGAIVEVADSATTGLHTLRRFRPHVLISDIGMPEEDGYSFIRRVRALGAREGAGTPSIALTAYTRAEDRSKALAAGFNGHVGKPVNPNDLLAAVAALLASAR